MGGGDGGCKDEEKPSERKVYSRRSFKGLDNSEGSDNLLRDVEVLKGQAVVSDGLNSTKRSHNNDSDNFSGLNREGLVVPGEFLTQESKVKISLGIKSKRQALELKRKLEGERDVVRSLMMKIEAKEGQVEGSEARDGGKVGVGTGQPRMLKSLNELSVSVQEDGKAGADDVEKEKRTPKANKFYKNSEFLLAKDKIRPAESNKKSKLSGKKGGGSEQGVEKLPNQVWKSCTTLLERLVKHKHGWVFNEPVDAVALGLHDYFEIIKNPMDLGTVKNRLAQNWYKSPMDFAEDVRLTFQNAMTYNPKGQDVYIMAELLSRIFEDKWVSIDCDLKLAANVDVRSPKSTIQKAQPQSRVRPHMKKANDRSESMAHSSVPKRKAVNAPQSSKIRVPKKPKAKDPNKREMTYDEKQKLSENLQNLPSEKLESVVQIIKKRNPSVSQQDDEIEVDIDSVDTETLWELDRFVTNYKKGLSKNKRNAEVVSVAIPDQEQNIVEKVTSTGANETPKGSARKKVVEPHGEVKEQKQASTNQGATQCCSSSVSGSSSTDSDGESLSAGASDGHSPKK